MQCACTILSSVACLVLQYFSSSHKRQDFWQKTLKTKCVFWFPLQHLWETFLILRRSERDVIKNIYWSSRKVPVNSWQILMKLYCSWQIFEIYLNIKFRENPSSGSRVVCTNAPKSEGKYEYCWALNVGAKNSKTLFFTAWLLPCDTSAATHGRQYLLILLLYISVEVIRVYCTGTLQSLLS
jgi:hypothetical protein